MSPRKSATLITLVTVTALVSSSVLAEQVNIGAFNVDYGHEGLWNDANSGQGLVYNGTEVTYHGIPWAVMSVVSDQEGDTIAESVDFSMFSLLALDAYLGIEDPTGYFDESSSAGSVGVFQADSLQIVKREIWDASSQVIRLDFTVTNVGCDPLTNVALMHAIDPDQDIPATFDTINDTVPSGRFAFSQGPQSDITVGYGVCDRDSQQVGHTDWLQGADATLQDDGQTLADRTMHIQQDIGSLSPGESQTFSFLFSAGDSDSDAEDYYYDALLSGACPTCEKCDYADIEADYQMDTNDTQSPNLSPLVAPSDSGSQNTQSVTTFVTQNPKKVGPQ